MVVVWALLCLSCKKKTCASEMASCKRSSFGVVNVQEESDDEEEEADEDEDEGDDDEDEDSEGEGTGLLQAASS